MTDEIMNSSDDPFAGLSDQEVRVLAPDYALKKIIGEDVNLKEVFSPENIEKAQVVIDEHKDEFLDWVRKDIGQLTESYAIIAADPAGSTAELHKLARAAFIIKSQAGTFGFSLATQVAKSLDDFCNNNFQPTPGHLLVIQKHIETLTAIFSKNIVGDGGAMGRELSDSLFLLVSKYKDKKA